MGYVVKAPAIVGVPVHGTSDLFPVRRIWCVGRNYAAHAREMGADTSREPPFSPKQPDQMVTSPRRRVRFLSPIPRPDQGPAA